MAKEDKSKTSKTARVMNLLSKKGTPAPASGEADAAASGGVNLPPIITPLEEDAEVSNRIKNALEDVLAEELGISTPAAPAQEKTEPAAPTQPKEPVPEHPQLIRHSTRNFPNRTHPEEPAPEPPQAAAPADQAEPKPPVQAEPPAPVEPKPPVQAEPPAPVQPKPPVQTEPPAPVEPKPPVQAEAPAPVEPKPPVQAEPPAPVQPKPPVQTEPPAPVEPRPPIQVEAPAPVEPKPPVQAEAPIATEVPLETPAQAAPPVPQMAASALENYDAGYINVMQVLVEEKADKYIKLFGLCQCERCLNDVKALALNHLPPKYVVMDPGERIPKLTFYEGRYDSEITTQIVQACKQVLKRPHHTR